MEYSVVWTSKWMLYLRCVEYPDSFCVDSVFAYSGSASIIDILPAKI